MALAVSLMAACSDDDGYAPGQPVSADCQQVYFSADNDTSLLLSTTDERVMELTVKRNTTVGALEVPIRVIDNADGFTIPDKAVFADGENTTVVEVVGPDEMEESVPLSFSIELTGDQIDPYTKLDGTSHFYGKMTIAKTFEATVFFANSKLGSCTQEIVQLSETQYRMQDFLHTGKTLIITVNGSSLSFSGDCGTSLWSGYWNFCDANGTYFPLYFSEDPSDTYIEYMYLYTSYCSARSGTEYDYFYLYVYYAGFSDDDSLYYSYLYIRY